MELRARRSCSTRCPPRLRPLMLLGSEHQYQRVAGHQGIDAEFLIKRAVRGMSAAGQALPGLAGCMATASRWMLAGSRRILEDMEGNGRCAPTSALRTCITPEEGEVPRELLLAAIALAASEFARVPVHQLVREACLNLICIAVASGL